MHVVDLTGEHKKTIYQNIQNTQIVKNQRKMGGSPNRRRRFVDTGDTGTYCIVLRNDERTTGKMLRACVRAFVRACVLACLRTCVRECVCFVFVWYVLRILYMIMCCVL